VSFIQNLQHIMHCTIILDFIFTEEKAAADTTSPQLQLFLNMLHLVLSLLVLKLSEFQNGMASPYVLLLTPSCCD